MALALPPGVKVGVELPPYSNLPNLTKEQQDVSALIVASLSTPHFPEAKKQTLAHINRTLAGYKYRRPLNRAQRRMKGNRT